MAKLSVFSACLGSLFIAGSTAAGSAAAGVFRFDFFAFDRNNKDSRIGLSFRNFDAVLP